MGYCALAFTLFPSQLGLLLTFPFAARVFLKLTGAVVLLAIAKTRMTKGLENSRLLMALDYHVAFREILLCLLGLASPSPVSREGSFTQGPKGRNKKVSTKKFNECASKVLKRP